MHLSGDPVGSLMEAARIVGTGLLNRAADVVVPVDECTVRVVSPGPHVQLEKWSRNVVPVGNTYQLKALTLEYGGVLLFCASQVAASTMYSTPTNFVSPFLVS